MTDTTDRARAETPAYDPFTTLGYPSLSFKDKAPGFAYTVKVTKLPEWVQCVDEDGNLAYWENDDGSRGGAKMAGVTEVQVKSVAGTDTAGIDDEEDWYRSVWAVKPSSLYHAIRRAVKQAREPVAVGALMVITYAGDGPKPASKLQSPQKLYEVDYTPAPAGTDAPPF